MYASTHPWRSAAVSLCGAAGLALAVGLGAAMETGPPALALASDAVVMPSATPLPAEPASTELDVPAADGVRVPVPISTTPPAAAHQPFAEPAAADEAPPADEAAPEAPTATESAAAPAQTRRPPAVGPPMPTGGDLDCADFERQSFPIDPADDPNNLDADSDGLACEPPPGSSGSTDLDCADFTERSFRIDPANDPNNLDADGDGLACEAPPDE